MPSKHSLAVWTPLSWSTFAFSAGKVTTKSSPTTKSGYELVFVTALFRRILMSPHEPMLAFSAGEVTTKSSPTTKSIALYGFCFAHSDCGPRQFCGNKCWTGQCGPNANIGMWVVGQFCQPCGECVQNSRSVTGSCNMCKSSGKEGSLL